ncbi:carbon storage regulator [Stratiformator vulcanicus]|uniref:Carbon storage regulator n=2 Tax=Stratiformator vulcanicus TaxID=2527980 RepID=A0A517QZX0_9PLAN|nr:carbon storage regulator [Stratiformator vulcanicus]
MRVITCRTQEQLVIDEDIRITVLEIDEEGVHIGVTQPGNEPEYFEYVLQPQFESDFGSDIEPAFAISR